MIFFFSIREVAVRVKIFICSLFTTIFLYDFVTHRPGINQLFTVLAPEGIHRRTPFFEVSRKPYSLPSLYIINLFLFLAITPIFILIIKNYFLLFSFSPQHPHSFSPAPSLSPTSFLSLCFFLFPRVGGSPSETKKILDPSRQGGIVGKKYKKIPLYLSLFLRERIRRIWLENSKMFLYLPKTS